MLHVDDSPPTVKISKAMRSAAMSHIEASTVDDSGTSGTFSYYVSSGTDGVMPALALGLQHFFGPCSIFLPRRKLFHSNNTTFKSGFMLN